MDIEKKDALEKAVFTGKAAEDLIRHRFDTPPEKLLELSILSSKQALATAIMKTITDGREFARQLAIYQRSRKKSDKPKMFWLSDRFVLYFLQAQRSTADGKTLKDLTDLAMAGIESTVEAEEFTEPIDAE